MTSRCNRCPAHPVGTWRHGTLVSVAIEHHRACPNPTEQLPLADWLGTIRPADEDTTNWTDPDRARPARDRTRRDETPTARPDTTRRPRRRR